MFETKKGSREDRIRGSVYGFTVGDAMGATTEFMSAEQIRRSYIEVTQIIGGGWLNLEPGEVTDDTQMTMAVMDALVEFRGGLDSFREECSNNFVTWLKTDPKDVGNQCRQSIGRLMDGETIPVQPSALGNGSLMRAMPCALVGRPDLNVAQGRLTHNNELCDQIIESYTDVLIDYLDGKVPPKRIVPRPSSPSGHIVNTFRNAMYWTRESRSFDDAIVGAVNAGGDADTIAAITGSLAGARWGYGAIPGAWIDTLKPDVKEKLEKFVKFVLALPENRTGMRSEEPAEFQNKLKNLVETVAVER